MDSDQRKLAKAFIGKSARACDNCVRRRARWYCAADDAFLCQSCDSSVHSANPLARRHDRVRLKSSTSSTNSPDDDDDDDDDDDKLISTLQLSVPSWHQGFRRKPRTPRGKKHGIKVFSDYNPLHLVPEICSEEGFSQEEENEEQLLYRVPVFEPLVAELCSNEADVMMRSGGRVHEKGEESKRGGGNCLRRSSEAESSDFNNHEIISSLEGIALPSEILDLEGFAADVESLLGKGLEDEPFDIEGLGLLHCVEESKECFNWSSGRVKVEQVAMGVDDQENHGIDVEFDMGRETTFELNFDYEYSPIAREEGEEDEHYQARKMEDQIFMNNLEDCKVDDSIKTFLKLDYEGIMSAWDEERSPWMNGERPEFNSSGFWPDCLGISGTMHALYGEMGMKSGHGADGAREARVSRYREKRRTRLFSKKIRYEVRKLNAEKRPRMKGRFVKRCNFSTAAAFPIVR